MKIEWDLSLFGLDFTDAEVNKAFENLSQLSKDHIARYSGKIKQLEAEDWLEYFESDEKLVKESLRIAQPIGLQSSLEQTNPEITKLEQLIESHFTQLSLLFLPLTQEIKELGYTRLIELSNNSVLSDYKNYFVQVARSVQFKLSLSEEKVITIKDQSLASNYVQLYDQLTAAKMYEFDGKEITEGEVRAKRTDVDPNVRVKAFKLLADYYGSQEQQIVRGATYFGIVSDWVNEAKLRGYPSAISVQNLSEEIEDELVEDLLEGVSDLYPVYQDFLKFKSKKLRVKQLNYSDIFAPLHSKKVAIDFKEGKTLVLETLSTIHPQVEEYIQNLFTEGRVDVFPKTGKQGGAFASYNKFWGQYVKLNYTNDLDSVTTLAHELGHAFHGEVSKNQPHHVYSTPLVLAETASTFFQLLVIESLVEKKPEVAEQMIFELCEDFFGTVVRQVQYVRFEKKMHQKIWDGGVFNWQDCNDVWASEVELMIGDVVTHDKALYKANWSAIPHIFHTPFYCYAYAYGLLFAVALYQNYKQNGNADKLISILSLGGSKTPLEILKIAGIEDIASMVSLGRAQVESWLSRLQR